MCINIKIYFFKEIHLNVPIFNHFLVVGICPRGGGICPGGICPAGICPDTFLYILVVIAICIHLYILLIIMFCKMLQNVVLLCSLF